MTHHVRMITELVIEHLATFLGLGTLRIVWRAVRPGLRAWLCDFSIVEVER